ncbi:MAG: DUF1266 domain-containing protein [Leifsonia sp.]
MGLFGKKKRVTDVFIAENRVPSEREPLLALGVGLIERDGGTDSSRVLKDPRGGKGAKYLLPMWGISDYATLQDVIESLIQSSRDPKINPDDVEKSVASTLEIFAKAHDKYPTSTLLVSEDQVRACTQFGAVRLEYAAYLVRLASALGYGTDQQIWDILGVLYAEVQSRFDSWTAYMIAVVRGYACTENTFGFPDVNAVDAYLRLEGDPASAYSKFPLGH